MSKMLPLSIALLAGAITIQAMLPARAAPAPAPAPAPVVEPAPAPPPPPPMTPNCQKFQGKLASPVSLSEVQSWMTQQQSTGRTTFVPVVTDLTYAVLCAY